ARAESLPTSRGLEDRIDAVPGDIFSAITATADVYLLKDVLHDWDDEHCRKILSTVARRHAQRQPTRAHRDPATTQHTKPHGALGRSAHADPNRRRPPTLHRRTRRPAHRHRTAPHRHGAPRHPARPGRSGQTLTPRH